MKNVDKQLSKINLLTKKLLNGTITPKEKEQLDDWYSENSAENPVWQLKNETKEQLRDRVFNSIASKIDFIPKNHTKRLVMYLSIAATVLIICGIGIFLWTKTINQIQVVKNMKAFSNGTITKVHLPDHSIVWLKGNSSLEYPSKFNNRSRKVTLNGEALFEVAKDKRHPFIITTERYITRVLGTSFNIDASKRRFKLTVLTGKVSISKVVKTNVKTSKLITVTPGNQFEAININTVPRITPIPVEEKAYIVSGTEYNMNFENARFEEIKARIERKFNITITTAQNTYNKCFLSADVTDQSLENTLKVISAVINAQYKINRNQIEFTGGGCN